MVPEGNTKGYNKRDRSAVKGYQSAINPLSTRYQSLATLEINNTERILWSSPKKESL